MFLFILITVSACVSEKCDCSIKNEILKENNKELDRIEKSMSWSQLGLQDYLDFKNDTYRLTIAPTWGNSQISEFKIENGWGKPKILINRYEWNSRSTNSKLNKIGQTEELTLSDNEWTEFDNLITEKCFWTMPVSSKEMYLDGTGWILEVKKRRENPCSNKNYHLVSRVDNSPIFFELCDKLLKLANSSKMEQDSLLYLSWTSD